MTTAVNSGAYFCAGTMVIVDDGRNPVWAGQIIGIGALTGSLVQVAVTDPMDNPNRWRGQRVVVASWRHLRHAFRARWSR